jgi:gentisate 1,2-dioxygenase
MIMLVVAATMVAWLEAAPAQAVDASTTADVQRIPRFEGVVPNRALRAAGKEQRISIDTWLIPNRQAVHSLAVPLRGDTVFELRGGSLVTVINGKRQKRQAGDFWTVPAGASISLETDNDSAALQTTAVGPRSNP